MYKLSCEKCIAVYIGQTGRRLNQRIKEHMRNYNTLSYSNHISEEKHKFSEKVVKILHKQQKIRKPDILESMEIYKYFNKEDLLALSEKENLHYSPIIDTI